MDHTDNINNKLKIGILIRDIDKLQNWEYRIIKGIIDDPRLELALFIKDGRKKINSFKSRLKRNLLTPKIFSNVLYTLQIKLESLIFRYKPEVDPDEIIEKTKNIETVYLTPERKGFFDIFSQTDAEKIKKYGLDIILRHEFNIIRGDILTAARYGIWSFHHADNAINRGGPAGFWEILNNEPCCGVTLQRLTPELDGGLIIDKAWFNWHWSFSKNNRDLLEKSVVLLFKNINILLGSGEIKLQKSLTYYNKLYKQPGMGKLLKYIAKFYCHVFGLCFDALFSFKRQDCWAVSYNKGKYLESALYKTPLMTMPKKLFWADPFLFRRGEELYVFFENYSYKTKTGKISAGKIIEKNGKYEIIDITDALNTGCHMSYPQIFEDDGEIFMIPETYHNNRLEIYRCVNFPDKWELYATAFDGEEVADTTYFRDENGERWLFLNKSWNHKHDSELYIYKIDSLKLNTIIPHKFNPVLIDCRKARSGGAIFKHNGELYRPSQINTHGIYGRGLQISKLKKLSLEEFEDEPVIAVEPNFRKGLIGAHHLHQLDDEFIFDMCFKKL